MFNRLLICMVLVTTIGCASLKPSPKVDATKKRAVTLLFTNDFESAFDPIPAYWNPDIEYLGGIAHIATLVENLRQQEDLVFLFDAGDIFTGVLSKKTEGLVPMEMMITMGYDAMAIGNHEFEYGWQSFARMKNRLPFPVLGANLFYAESGVPYAQAYSVIEKNGVRIGVIGVMGQDAGTAIIPSNVRGIEIHDPIESIKPYVKLLRPQVDLIVVLTHQGKTAPMQTDDEARKDIQRGIAAEINLANEVPGIDVIFSGHADSGTESPFVHQPSGTLIMQTYGQGTRLGFLQLQLEQTTESINITSYEGRLLPVVSNDLAPHPIVARKLAQFKAQYPELQETVCFSQERVVRLYNEESDLGNLYADILREYSNAEIGFMPSGALRKDLPKGDVPLMDVIDSFPFTDEVAELDLTGKQILRVLEQSLSLERGMLQVSGLRVEYSLDRPVGDRVISVLINGADLQLEETYHVSTIEIMAQGGDLYSTFKEIKRREVKTQSFSSVLEDHLRRATTLVVPKRGRLLAIDCNELIKCPLEEK